MIVCVKDMILDAIYGIRDPIRDDVPSAVAMCQSAGIMVNSNAISQS